MHTYTFLPGAYVSLTIYEDIQRCAAVLWCARLDGSGETEVASRKRRNKKANVEAPRREADRD